MKFRPKTEDIVLVLITIALFVSSIVLGVIVFSEEEEKESDLKVEEVYFVMKGIDDQKSEIDIIVFVTNTGEEDVSTLLVRAFSVEIGSNLAKDDSSVEIQNVKHKTTVEGRLTIEVPNKDYYRVELLIFEDGKLEIIGSGTIDLTGVGVATDYRTYPSFGDACESDEYSLTEDGSDLAPLFCLFLLFLFFIGGGIILFFIIWNFSRKKPKVQMEKKKLKEVGEEVGPCPPWMLHEEADRPLPLEEKEHEQKPDEEKEEENPPPLRMLRKKINGPSLPEEKGHERKPNEAMNEEVPPPSRMLRKKADRPSPKEENENGQEKVGRTEEKNTMKEELGEGPDDRK